MYDAAGTGAEAGYRYDPPYQIVKEDGTIVPDKMKVFLPAGYTGRIARIDYRIIKDNEPYIRGCTYFVLP